MVKPADSAVVCKNQYKIQMDYICMEGYIRAKLSLHQNPNLHLGYTALKIQTHMWMKKADVVQSVTFIKLKIGNLLKIRAS